MSRWGEEYDEELQNKKEVEVGIMIDFKSMCYVIERISDETGEWDAKHPKDKLMLIWWCVMAIFLILFTLSYNVIIIATAFFMIFYFFVLYRLSKAWKRFNYSRIQFWLLTIVGLVVDFVAAWFIRGMIF